MTLQVRLAGHNGDVHAMRGGFFTPETISAAYARISRSSKPVYELREESRLEIEAARKSNRNIVFGMGHHSVAEHAVFNFDVLGVSRLAIEALEWHRLCVTGDTVLLSATEKAPRKRTIKQLYDAWSDPKKHRVRKVKLRSVTSDGVIVSRGVKNVIKVGVASVYEVRTRCGRKIKATHDERFLTQNGYKQLDQLRVGDKIAANGLPAHKNRDWIEDQYIKKNLERREVAALAGVSDACLGKWIRLFGLQKPKASYPNRRGGCGKEGMHSVEGLQRIREARSGLNNEAWKGERASPHAGRRRAHRKFETSACCACGSKKALVRHHLDENPLNNENNNVIILCSSCHRAHHGGRSALTVFYTPVTSIEYVGEEDVYDLEMEGEEHNYVANGLVVHNCSFTEKSQRYIKLDGDYVIPEEFNNDESKMVRELIYEQNEYYRSLYPRLLKLQQALNPDKKKALLEGAAKEDARYVVSLATEGQLGFTANARNLELIIRRFRYHPLAEVRHLGNLLYQEARKVAPSLILMADKEAFEKAHGVTLEDEFFKNYRRDLAAAVGEVVPESSDKTMFCYGASPFGKVRLLDDRFRVDSTVVGALLFDAGVGSPSYCRDLATRMSLEQMKQLILSSLSSISKYDSVPRAFEEATFRFEIMIDASAMAQLKRHRMSTQQWGPYDPKLGVILPPSIEKIDAEEEFFKITAKTSNVWTDLRRRLEERGESVEAADYVLTNAHRRMVSVTMNLRELYHFSRMREDEHAQWAIRGIANQMCNLARFMAPASTCLLAGKHEFEERSELAWSQEP